MYATLNILYTQITSHLRSPLFHSFCFPKPSTITLLKTRIILVNRLKAGLSPYQ
ncbi:hypothetical protein PAXRUDRAFT_785713 [Paxillus rubicundulus Ve08.2h10]|uniref:Uncharacterized protein n=1 Tax=Paxillus rubicundulus Ve08.2h10 TaxID=930991 RepID=A0A0D0E163_9AGAM|nr:hypothetical protein PAXRUDRAFT_785713 [Paxillus rubicundulus Ve08.2h10]